ncbi:MAG: cytochrome c biogenesis protein CcsA [Armatimonadota bacterium]
MLLAVLLISIIVIFILGLTYLFTKDVKIFKFLQFFLLLYILGIIFLITVMYINLGYMPFSTPGETLVFLLLFVSVILYYLFKSDSNPVFVLSGTFFMALINVLALFLTKSGKMFPDILNTNLFYIHVLLSMISYGFLFVGFLLTLLYLIFKIEIKQYDMIYKAGIFFYFTLLVSGSIWAQNAWGLYWGADPKETGALLTFIIYMCGVHSEGKQRHIFYILGFISLIFCYVGITYLMKGLHSY